jgi:nucleoside-diphosphate-sugar epimerase
MRVVVTGANGFIGQHLCQKLIEEGKGVTACIREQVDASVFGPLSSSLRLCRIPSLDRDAALSGIFENADAVIHLAGRAHVMRETEKDPLSEFRRINVIGTEALVSAAVQAGVTRFIYLSSIKVNGEATNGDAFTADDQPDFADPYGQSKWEAEERLRHVTAGTHMEWVILRPPLVYGPGVRGNFLSLMKWVFRGVPLPLGSVENRRSLVSVFNLCDLLSLLLDHPAAANNCFLASDSEDISTPDLVRLIAMALHRSPRILRCPEAMLLVAGALLRQRDAVQRLCSSLVLDRQKVGQILGWSAPMTVERGLGRTAEWFLTRVAEQ